MNKPPKEVLGLVTLTVRNLLRTLSYTKPKTKAGKDRDTVSVEPGSRRIFGSVSVSESRFWGILCSKDTFCLY